MSFEKGGRADKQGNVYENRCLARILIRLVAEEITSVVVEPVEENSDICEFYTVAKDGSKTYYQCKGSNGMNDHWRPSDLQRYNLFSRVQALLRGDPTCKFCFVSPLYYGGLEELCARAKTYPSAKSFYANALSNKNLLDSLSACERCFKLSHDNDDQLNELVNLLSRCEFLVRPNNSEMVQDLEQIVGIYFWGTAETTRVLLENFVNDTASYGKGITVSDIVKYLRENGVSPRVRMGDTRIVPVITRLNKRFVDSYDPIQGCLFHRESTERIIHEIDAGKSVVLHGKAGVGKSGCVRELINYLESNHIDYLAIQLDKHIPHDFADKYGESLGLPGSPVSCLSAISGSKPCVLILDQLDALRWTAMHSSTALDICKEMIEQVRAINKHASGHMSVVFSVRTFDYENDAGIQSLFNEEEQEERDSSWSEINVGILTDDEVKQIIGDEYDKLTGRVKELIRVPSSLYVWLKLDSKRRSNQITSSQEMVRSWWSQIQDNYAAAGHNGDSLASCIDELVAAISNSASFSLPHAMFPKYTHEIKFLASCGVLRLENNTVSFVHQSFLDSFLLANDLNAIFTGRQDLLSLVLSWGTQMPMFRYRLSALFQNIAETNQALFSKQAKDLLGSDQIHYYFKAAVFETIGQLSTPVFATYKLLDEFFETADWHSFILQTVYERHPVFIEHLAKKPGFDWLSEEGFPLLVSMRYYSPGFVASIIRKMMETGEASPEKTIAVLGTEIDAENEQLFALRMEIYDSDSSFLSGIHFINFERTQPDHIIQVLNRVLGNADTYGAQHVYIDDKDRPKFCEENYISIIRSLFDLLCNSAKDTPLSLHPGIDFKGRYWLPRQHESSIARETVELVKTSLGILAQNNSEEALAYIEKAGSFRNGISNELALSTLLALPTDYSDSAIEWLLSDFDNHILDCISNEHDYLATCKDILKKHSPSCSDVLFARLEERICTWKGDRERFISSYKYRIELNRTKEQEPVFWPAWGHLQKALLPFLDSTRTTQKAKELLAVLNRNEWVRSDSYHAGILSGPARSVVSTIHKNAARLSDNTWLRIVNSHVDEQHSRLHEKDDGDYYYESTHWAFSQDLGSCVKSNPTRYAKLLLKFPQKCFPGYYSAVLYGLNNSETNRIDFTLLCDVIRHCTSIDSGGVPTAIARIISERHDEDWPEDILSYLSRTATGPLKPVGNERIFSSRKDDPFPSPDDMATAVLNCPRGAAVDTVGDVLIRHPDLTETFAPLMETLAQDESDVIRFALVKCAAAYYEPNPSFSKQIFDTVIEKDLLAMCARHSFWLMRKDLQALEEQYFPYLKVACDSPNQKLVVRASQMICSTAILTSSEQVLDYLYSHTWSKETVDKICLEATYAFEDEGYRTISQTILEHFLESDAASLHSINRLFHENRLDLKRDEHFISQILKSRGDFDTINAFIDFIKKQDGELSGFAETIKTAVESVDEGEKTWQKYRIEDGLVHAVIRLIDSANGDNELTECCLDILDEIYRKRILTDSAISKLLEGAE